MGKLMSLMIVVALLALAQEPAVQPAAATPPAAVKPTEVAPADVEGPIKYGIIEGRNQPKPKKVCFDDAVSGSRIPTKRCMDRKEFMERQQETREYIGKFQREIPLSR